MHSFDYAMSIGPTCAAAYHIRRVFGRRAIKGIFDWQVTPLNAFIRYLQRDFAGCFELADLHYDGAVHNSVIDTLHPHEFKAARSTAEIAAIYWKDRGRHDHLCRQTRKALMGKRGRLLVVTSERLASIEVFRAERAIREYNPELQFTLVQGPPRPAEGSDWHGSTEAWDDVLVHARQVEHAGREVVHAAVVAHVDGDVRRQPFDVVEADRSLQG